MDANKGKVIDMKKLLYIGLGIFTLFAIVSGGYLFNTYKTLEKNMDEMQIEFPEDEEKAEAIDKGDPLLFLLLGIGDRPNDPGRADSIICVSVNPKNESVLMFNIPRDTRTEIVGKGIKDKINHSYAFGGTEMAKKTVEHFIEQPIDYVVQVNMNGFRELVDTVGGIEVENKFAFDQADELGKKTHHYDEGLISLDGERALHYSRMRKTDPRGDFGRNERQRQVLSALVDKATNVSSIFKIQDFNKIIGNNVKTNISFDELKSFFALYTKEWKNFPIETLEIKGEETIIDNIYYYEVSEEERERIASSIKENISITAQK